MLTGWHGPGLGGVSSQQQEGFSTMSQTPDFTLPPTFTSNGPPATPGTQQPQQIFPTMTGFTSQVPPATPTPQGMPSFAFGLPTPGDGTPVGDSMANKRPRVDSFGDSTSGATSVTASQMSNIFAQQQWQGQVRGIYEQFQAVQTIFQFHEAQIKELRTENVGLREQQAKMAEGLATIQKRLGEMEVELAEKSSAASDAKEDGPGAAYKNDLAVSMLCQIRQQVLTVSFHKQAAVRRISYTLVGVNPSRGQSTGGKSRQKLILPPPREPGEPPRMEGAVEIHNPIWTDSAKVVINQNFLHAVTNCVVNTEKVSCLMVVHETLCSPSGAIQNLLEAGEFEVEDVMAAAQTFFRTLCQRYKAQINEGVAAKQAAKAVRDKLESRKKTKQRMRLNAAGLLEEKLGEHAKGWAAFVDVGFMSSDDDGPGLVDKDVWNERVKAEGTSTMVWETHRLLWRNPKVKDLLNDDCAILNLSKLVRYYYACDYVAFNEQNVTPQAHHFHGFHANDNKKGPNFKRAKLKSVYEGMTSGKWERTSGIVLAKKAMPPLLNFDGLVIPDDCLSAADLVEVKKLEAYEADDEMENMEDAPAVALDSTSHVV